MDYDYDNNDLSAEIPEVAELETSSEETQEVAVPAVVSEEQETAEQEAQAQETQAQEAQAPLRSEADARFAQMRREAEIERNRVGRLTQVLRQAGIPGETPEEITDIIAAHAQGKTVEEVRQARITQEQENFEINRLRAENKLYRAKVNEQVIQNDLKDLQALDPTIKSIHDLGPKFIELKYAGWGTEEAYKAVKALENKATPPPVIGKVNSKTTSKKEYYTPEEVDRLTERDLDDPKVMETVMKSMTKWK